MTKSWSLSIHHILFYFAVVTIPQFILSDSTEISLYSVNTTIHSRFAETLVTVEFQNHADCSAVRGFTMQLPRHARVKSLNMFLSDGCELDSKLLSQSDATTVFQEAASTGKPSALLTAWDSTNYAMSVSVPPLGTARVELRMEELLVRKRNRIPFQIPLSPGAPVGRLLMNLEIKEPLLGISQWNIPSPSLLDEVSDEFSIDRSGAVAGDGGTTILASLDSSSVSNGDEYPRLFHASYDSHLPQSEGGVVLHDEEQKCVLHLFNPIDFLPSESQLPRFLLFVIDVSGSMMGQKLIDAKAAFSSIIQSSLTNADVLTVHTFSYKGIEDSWGPFLATEDARSNAMAFVQSLEIIGGTNLYGAYVDAINVAKNRNNDFPSHASIVVLLTDGEATVGETTDSKAITKDVALANVDQQVKIYAIAFGQSAAYGLLLGISMMNGGIATRVYEGFGDSADQLEQFFEGELGRIVLSDVQVRLEGIREEEVTTRMTQSNFPFLPHGSEISVRALLLSSSSDEDEDEVEEDGDSEIIRTSTMNNHGGNIRFITTGRTSVNGDVQTWEAQINNNDDATISESVCAQGFAHGKIEHLMQFRTAVQTLGDDLLRSYALENFPEYTIDDEYQSLADWATNHAQTLALEYQLVWPSLTALVTTPNEEACPTPGDGTSVCREGDGIRQDRTEEMEDSSSGGSSSSGKTGKRQGGTGDMGNTGDMEAHSDSSSYGTASMHFGSHMWIVFFAIYWMMFFAIFL